MNKKKTLIIIGIIIVVAITFFALVGNKDGNVKTNNTLSKAAEEDSVISKIENILKENNYTYDEVQKNATNYGATRRIEYALSDGTIFEVYEFVENSTVYEDILKNGNMYLLGTDTKYKVDVVKKLNVAIKYIREGSKIKEVKDMLK